VLGYTHNTPIGVWDSTASYAFSEITDIRGFLRPDLTNDGSQNADSQNQRRRLTDSYFDSHFSADLGHGVDLLYGADLLYGLGKQTSINGAYYAPLNGRGVLPATTALHVDEINSLSDQRAFFGQYAQVDWKATRRLDVFAGIRLNETTERQLSTHIDGFDAANDLVGRSSRRVIRPSGMVGASYAVMPVAAVVFADYRDTFKPSAIDFGPDFTPNVLAPETARQYEAGVKGKVLGGLVEYETDAFRVDFKNLVVATTDASGNPILENAGGQTLQGFEVALGVHPLPALTLSFNGSYHDSRFTQYVATEGGSNINVAGNELPLSPRWLGSVGVLYQPESGFTGSVIGNFVGRRYLDLANSAPVGGYVTVAASAGYRFGRYEVLVDGTNLTDERPPVTESEFGDSSYYRLVGRTVLVSLEVRL
jgi:outer membrane receptor protein involved in Fe transport